MNNGELKATKIVDPGKQTRWLISIENAREFYERRYCECGDPRRRFDKPWGGTNETTIDFVIS